MSEGDGVSLSGMIVGEACMRREHLSGDLKENEPVLRLSLKTVSCRNTSKGKDPKKGMCLASSRTRKEVSVAEEQ